MKKQKNGGPAFARPAYFAPDDGFSNDEQRGMTTRDYFAAKAMQAIISKAEFQADPQTFEVYEKTAIGAYDYADYMLKERDKEVDTPASP